jgi:isoleucyl-tRNA synthetase
MKYSEHKNINYPQIAEEILDFWKKNEIFEKSVNQREGSPSFTFYEGPPSANGLPGIHHVMARAIKDLFCRFQTLKGKQVNRKGGWDTHGLPVELQVEKELEITKQDIGKTITVEQYNQKCKEAVMRYKGIWDDLTEKMGYWVDLDDPYITFKNDYIETLWNLLKQIYDKGYLYKGYTIQPFSPAAGTGLSSHELNQPGCYQNVKDTTIVAQFKVKDTFNDYFLAWTTTPWTLPSNSALAIGKNIEYVKVSTHNRYTNQPVNIILAKAAVSRILDAKKYIPSNEYSEEEHGNKKTPYTIVEICKGEVLAGMKYEQLMPFVQPLQDADKAFQVIIADFVTTEDGTGIVHIAPTFGADDLRAAQKNGVPAITILDEDKKEVPLVDRQGRFVAQMGEYANMAVKPEFESDEVRNSEGYEAADVKISVNLKKDNKAFKIEKYEHNYPHCWRTKKPILYYPLDSWFIKTTAVRDRMVELNKTINWKPKSTGEGRFGNWLENLVDWNLSRSRYWGTPLPIWRSEDSKDEVCVGSVSELQNLIEKANSSKVLSTEEIAKNNEFSTKLASGDADLHRPYVDYVTLLSENNKTMKRELDLIDVWFDSGAMPYAQWHYPFENEGIYKNNFPADFIAEGVDQTRGWFFTLHAISVMLNDKVAYKNVVSNGLVLDEKGEKMSKSKGNAIDAFEMLNKYGSDPVRWYMIENSNPWDNLKFAPKGVEEAQRRFFGTLKNTYAFFALYANLDKYNYSKDTHISIEKCTESDRWIISKLNSLVKICDTAYSDYDATKAARAISSFLMDDVSNWYVRLNRKRFWKDELNENKKAAYQTLYLCLETLSRISSPIAPFYMDFLYRDLHKANKDQVLSVHLSDFPVADETLINTELEARMEMAQRICSLVHSLRKKEQIRVRQPLQKVMIPLLNSAMKKRIEAFKDLIKIELNIKEIEYLDENSDTLVKKIKANFRKLGKQYGKQMKSLSAAIAAMSQKDIKKMEQTGEFAIDLDGQMITLTSEDVEISSQDIEGWLVASENELTVALDITLTQELKEEGIARDLVNRIQNLRKDTGLEVQDKINVLIKKGEAILTSATQNYKNYVCQETQALSLELVDEVADGTTFELEDFEVVLSVKVGQSVNG